MRNLRKWTCLLMNAMDDGTLSPRAVADMCLAYMSEEDVHDMCDDNELDSLDPEANED